MSTSHVATRLVALCREGRYQQAHEELYAGDAVSIEPEGAPESVTRGLPAIAEKRRQFEAAFEIHGGLISDAIIADPFFACTLLLEVTERQTGLRRTLSEIGVYEVNAGKIVSEQFFYRPRPVMAAA